MKYKIFANVEETLHLLVAWYLIIRRGWYVVVKNIIFFKFHFTVVKFCTRQINYKLEVPLQMLDMVSEHLTCPSLRFFNHVPMPMI